MSQSKESFEDYEAFFSTQRRNDLCALDPLPNIF